MSKTDKELFRDYLNSKLDGGTVGTTYFGSDNYEYHELDSVLRDIANSVIMGEVPSGEGIDEAIGTFRNVIADLERVKAGFIAYKAAQETAE